MAITVNTIFHKLYKTEEKLKWRTKSGSTKFSNIDKKGKVVFLIKLMVD